MRLTKVAPLFAAAVAAGIGAASTAHAALTVDLRITAVSAGGGAISANKKTLLTPIAGTTVTMNVWAQVTGSDPSKFQCLQSVTGSFISANGGLLVNSQAAGAIVPSAFQGLAFSAGLVQDLDSDGDSDIGSNNQADADNFFRARSPKLLGPSSNADGAALPGFTSAAITGGTEYRIAQLKFIIGAGSPAGTTLNFRPDSVFEGAVWAENADEVTSEGGDGTAFDYSGGTTLGGDTGIFTSGSPVIFPGVPEPTSLGLLGIAGLGLLARRRK